MVMHPYPHYRDSGNEWLGGVPEHWDLRPLKSVLARNDSGVWGDDADDEDFNETIVLRSTEQTVDGSWSIRDPARRKLSLREKTSALLAAGDLVVTKSSGSEFHIGKASLVTEQVAQLNACFSNFMQRLRCSPVFEPRLAWYLLNSPVGRQQLVFHSNTTTGLANLNGTILGEVIAPVPPLHEQRAIAAFLDRETGRIDGLVVKKRLLIERLEEYRTALITRTVTRGLPPEAARAAGLDPSPLLKASGVEWLGDVPEHWDAVRLRDCGDIQTGPFGSQLHAEEYVTGGVPVVNPSNLLHGRLVVDPASTVAPAKADELARHALREGDIAFGRRGEMARAARIDQSDLPALCGTGCLRVRPNSWRADSRFLLYSLGLDGLRKWLETVAVGSTLANLNEQIVGRMPVALPPLGEQLAIVNWLGRRLGRATELVERAAAAVEVLQEYRTALITAAVTGKIDVRETAQAPADAVSA